MAGSSVYLTKEEKELILSMFNESMNFPDEELEKIRKSIEEKMKWHLIERF